MKNEEDYTYKCKPQHVILVELFKDEYKEISKLSKNSYDPHTGNLINKQVDVYKKLYYERAKDIDQAIDDDRQRVLKNMVDIPLNYTVRISPNVLLQRVYGGLIYMYETYSNQGAASSVIHKTSTFVPLHTSY
jgi:hypothetical protein